MCGILSYVSLKILYSASYIFTCIYWSIYYVYFLNSAFNTALYVNYCGSS
jgi:hypothetical protein